jgi:hypothetical protein
MERESASGLGKVLHLCVLAIHVLIKMLADAWPDATQSDAEHLQAVRVEFFAPGNDSSVWRGSWYPATAKMQTVAYRAAPLDQSWSAGRAVPILVVQGLQDQLAPPDPRYNGLPWQGGPVASVIARTSLTTAPPKRALPAFFVGLARARWKAGVISNKHRRR